MAIKLTCPNGLQLRSLDLQDAGILLSVVETDRSTFDRWVRWSAAVTTVETAQAFLSHSIARERIGDGFHLGLWDGDQLVGGIPCWSINSLTQVAELGYWLVPSARGKGVAEQALRVVMGFLEEEYGIRTVEFQCLLANAPSRKLAERVGGHLHEIRAPSMVVGGKCSEHAVYLVALQSLNAER